MRTALCWSDAPYPRCNSGHEVLPLGQRGRAAKLVGLPVDEMAFLVEVVVD